MKMMKLKMMTVKMMKVKMMKVTCTGLEVEACKRRHWLSPCRETEASGQQRCHGAETLAVPTVNRVLVSALTAPLGEK
ncbi:hypothetical protein BaRGS_00034800 [Batillaria attramentaria]|uniref:Secreted protein n=1 Tax=Batillaria attramentaria TaxID=370345 RepID=A0ABD0JH58_9CAEN